MFFDSCLHFLQFHTRSEILKRKAAAGRIFGVAPCLRLPATIYNQLGNTLFSLLIADGFPGHMTEA